MTQTRGTIMIHSTPSALTRHIDWALGGIFDVPISLDWIPQPALPNTYRSEYSWTGPIGTAAQIASVLKTWERLRFEATEEPTATSEGVRYSFTPNLGIFAAQTNLNGDIMIHEDRIKAAMFDAETGKATLQEGLDKLLGTAWDEELESFRYAGDGAPVRWLHKVG